MGEGIDIDDLSFLLEIPGIKNKITGELLTLREVYKKDIAKLKKEYTRKVQLFPIANTKKYEFEIERLEGKWEIFVDDELNLPIDHVVPRFLFDRMIEFEVSPEATHSLEFSEFNQTYKVLFTRLSKKNIVGTVIIKKDDVGSNQKVVKVRLSQYLNLCPEERWRIINKYIECCPAMLDGYSKLFFTHFLPQSEELIEIIEKIS